MNIKDKLTLRFVAVFTLCWGLASIIIYLFSSTFRREEFYQRLESRAQVAARLLLSVEEVDASLLQKIEDANPLKLPGEKITIYDFRNNELFSTDTQDSIRMDQGLFDRIRLEGQKKWKQGNVEVLGLLYTDDYDRVVVVAGAEDLYGMRKMDNLRNVLLIVFLISVLVITLAARLYAGRALKPIAGVIAEVNEIGETNLNERVSEGNGKDEIAVLGITFNQLLERLQKAFESHKSFIANASHELRTPITRLRSQVDVTLLQNRTNDDYKEVLASVKEDLTGLSDLVAKLLALLRADTSKVSLVPLRLDAILWQAVSEVTKSFSNPVRVDLSSDIEDEKELMISGDEQLIRSALTNLIENACKYSQDKEVSIRLWPNEGRVFFQIKDRGVGISPEEIQSLGQPFFRGSNVHSETGSGIGLSVVRRVVEVHKGTIEIRSELGEGTTITLSFPNT